MRFSCASSPSKRPLKDSTEKNLARSLTRVHNLIYLPNKIGIKPPEPIGRFIVKLNEASVATRYPEEISKLQKDFTQRILKDILSNGREALDG